MITEIQIHTMDEVLALLGEQEYDARIGRHRSPYMYRGMLKSSFRMETSILRNCKEKWAELEGPMLRSFLKYSVQDIPYIRDSEWKQMIIGQHYGLPTRLLDWSYSPLVGLHFATAETSPEKLASHDCVLWKIDTHEINRLLPQNYQDALKAHSAYHFTVEMMADIAPNVADYDRDMAGRSFVMLEPPSIDARIITQYSYFSVVPQGMDDMEGFLNAATEHTVRYVIDRNLRWQIRDFLDQMGISERITYPGLEGLSQWLKRHFYVKTEK